MDINYVTVKQLNDDYAFIAISELERLMSLVGPAGHGGQVDEAKPNHWHTPEQYFDLQVGKFEGTFQRHPRDIGNYVGDKLIGTMRGVTPVTYATYKEIPAKEVTVDMMKSITHEVAMDIGLTLYYDRPNFDTFVWCPPTEILVDWGWGSGPHFVIRRLQEKLGILSDGVIGPITDEAFTRFVKTHGFANASNTISDWRWEHWDSISRPGSRNEVFRNGWYWRANFFRSSNEEWWPKNWQGEI